MRIAVLKKPANAFFGLTLRSRRALTTVDSRSGPITPVPRQDCLLSTVR